MNALTFSLDPGFPSGATIDSASGVFRWTPATNQPPSTNVVTVRVTDNGSPTASDAQSFTIVTTSLAAFRLTSVSASANGVVTLNWNSQAGRTYRVEFKDDLNVTNWNALPDQVATGSTLSATNSPAGAQRYYRVFQVN